MRYALLSDVHGNAHALQAVLDHAAAQRDLAATYHLGDLVGYASAPNEVIEMLRAFRVAGVAGNYDSTVAADYKHCGCRSESPRQEALAHLSFEWTRRHVRPSAKRFLAGLPFRIDLKPLGGHATGPTATLVHATPTSNLVYVTEDRSDAFLGRMAQQAGLRPGDVLCFGHTHRPWHREVEGIHFVNTGSVGRPKDGDPRAGYVVLDVDAAPPSVDAARDGAARSVVRVEIVRVDYDVEAASRELVAAGLPEEFAAFLRAGGEPVTQPDAARPA